jgi:hypothetical protein
MNNNQEHNKKIFKRPVSWLMGRELLAGLKWIAAYAFMGDKLDAKDWMAAGVIEKHRQNHDGKEPFWFDYIADTGDGMSAVYNIAYLCMGDLWIDKNTGIGANNVALAADTTYQQQLPRGAFLFVGGDTAYHIADTASITERFQTPFNWAYDDLIKSGKFVDKRPIYGIPANHDYYDALDGFNRQFRQPITAESDNPKAPPLGLSGYERTQTASYVALHLPFDWCLWGFDSQDGKMDKRQQAFFVSSFAPDLASQGAIFDNASEDKIRQELQERVPAKLIVTTPEPSTVFGKWAKTDADIVETFKRLGLEPSFLKDKNGSLNNSKCRLDISGDIHHYERYWGGAQNTPNPTNYASVVAGGGGAFLHPSHTDINEVEKQALYPSRKDSHRLITQAILNPWNIFRGGYIWLAGAFIAFMSYFAVTIPQSTWSLFKLIPENLRPQATNQDMLSTIRAALDTSAISQSSRCCSSTYYFDLIYIMLFVGLLVFWLWRTPGHFETAVNGNDTPVKFSGTPEWGRSVLLFILPIIVGFLPLVFLVQLSREDFPHSILAGGLIDLFIIAATLLFSLSRRYCDILIDRARFHRETPFELMPLWILNILGVIFAVFGFLRYGAYSSSVMTFDLLITIVWSLSTVGLVALAVFAGGQFLNNTGKIRFAAIGILHVVLQVAVPVCLVLYSSWTTILIISVIVVIITLSAGQLFTRDFLVKNLSLADQKKLGYLLFAAWGIVGICVLLAASWGDTNAIAVDCWRLLAAFFLGAFFSCIWFGWYLAVALAFHGHNNEAGGGARSERYRHMIRFKLTENTLTGYVIGIDKPVTDFSVKESQKFWLVDVFTLHAQ